MLAEFSSLPVSRMLLHTKSVKWINFILSVKLFISEIVLKKSTKPIVKYKVYVSECSIAFKKKRMNSRRLNPSCFILYTLSID